MKHEPESEVASMETGRLALGFCQAAASAIGMLALVLISKALHTDWNSVIHLVRSEPLKIPQFITPCVIFGLAISAYYQFITEFKKLVAGLSFINALIALTVCLMLAHSNEWWDHLRLLFALFFSFVVWDVLMMDYFLPRELKKLKNASPEDREDIVKRIDEVRVVSYIINMPTLLTVFVVWLFGMHLRSSSPPESLESYVSGVVSFHLTFASVSYLVLLCLYKRDKPKLC